MRYHIGFDCGGTFTDAVALDDEGNTYLSKVPSTPKDFTIGTIEALQEISKSLSISAERLLKDTELCTWSSTIATNALATRSGSKVGLITTSGFEDTILIGRLVSKVKGLSLAEAVFFSKHDKPEPLAPRYLIRGVDERVDYKGEIVVSMNVPRMKELVKELVDEGVEAIAVCLIWSFMNPKHEQQIKRYIEEKYPNIFVSISSELAPLMKEYERTATTLVNSYVGKIVTKNLTALADKLRKYGYTKEPLVMQSSGGVVPLKRATEYPIGLMSSGPSGGVIASLMLGEVVGDKSIITSDVGGTSFDVGLIVNGERMFSETAIFSQYETLVPVVDVTSIGAGGGSIAWIEPVTNLLKVGPQSAGAEPGPVCYDKGGTRATVTDADITLNRLDANYFLGGKIKINKAKAVSAISEQIAKPLHMSVEAAAMGILDVIDAHMADLVRSATVQRGYDPRRFSLYAYGGAGPTHVGSYAKQIKPKRILVPFCNSEFSSFGVARCDLMYISDVAFSLPFELSEQTARRINEVLKERDAIVSKVLSDEGIKTEDINLINILRMKYRGQVHVLDINIPTRSVSTVDDLQKLLKVFEDIYEQRYGRGTGYKHAGIEITELRVQGVGKIKKSPLKKYPFGSKDPSMAHKGRRDVYWGEFGGFRKTDIYERSKLQPGNIVEGPAIIEAYDTTIVVHPQQTAGVDEYLNTVINLGG